MEDIDQLKAAHDAASGSTGPGRRWNTESLNRAAVVLLCAHFEGFLEDLFRESVASMENAHVPSGSVPRVLVMEALSEDARKLSQSKDMGDRVATLQRLMNRIRPFVDPTRPIQPGEIDTTPITRSLENPTTEKVKALYSHLGFQDILDGVSWRAAGNQSVRRNINELVDLRNKIAHGEREVPVVWADVDRYRKYVVGTSGILDAKLRDHLRSLTGANPW